MARGKKAAAEESNPGPDGSRDLLAPRDAEEQEAFEEKQRLKEAALAKKTPANERYAEKQALAEADQKEAAKANAA